MPGSPVSARSVLCIDDNAAVLQMQKALLEAFGFRVITAPSAQEGIERALCENVDAVILDYDMPSLNGAHVAAALKSVKPGLPIILYSAYPAEVVHKALPFVDGFVEKASSPGALHTELQRVLIRHAPPRQKRRFLRYPVHVPFAITLLRGGSAEVLHGTVLDLAEGGLGGVVEGQLIPGDTVSLQLPLPHCETMLKANAQVRYRNNFAHGFEFVDLSAPEQVLLRRCCRELARA